MNRFAPAAVVSGLIASLYFAWPGPVEQWRDLETHELEIRVGQEDFWNMVCQSPEMEYCARCINNTPNPGPASDCTQPNVVGHCAEAPGEWCEYWLYAECGQIRQCTFGKTDGVCSQCHTTSTPCGFPGCYL